MAHQPSPEPSLLPTTPGVQDGRPLAIKKTTVRFHLGLWARIEKAAREEGMTPTDFVRDCVVFRLGYDAGKRDAEREAQARHGHPVP